MELPTASMFPSPEGTRQSSGSPGRGFLAPGFTPPTDRPWGLSVTVWREGDWAQILPTPLAAGRVPGWGVGVTALTDASSSSRAHQPPRLRAIASLRCALASGPLRRPAGLPGQVLPGAALLCLSPARGAVPGVAGSGRVAGGWPAAGMEEGNALGGEVQGSSRPLHLGR